MNTAGSYTKNLLLELYAELSTLIPCFTDTETFERALLASWFQSDVKNISDRFHHLERIVYGKHSNRRDHANIANRTCSFMPTNVEGLRRLEDDIDIHRTVKYGDWFLQYLKDAEIARRILNRHLPEAEEKDRFYALNFSECPREELQRYMKAYAARTHRRSLAFWARDFEVSMTRAKVSVSKIKNAIEDWLSDEKLGKAKISSDGVQTRVTYTSKKRRSEGIPLSSTEVHPHKLCKLRR